MRKLRIWAGAGGLDFLQQGWSRFSSGPCSMELSDDKSCLRGCGRFGRCGGLHSRGADRGMNTLTEFGAGPPSRP